VALGVKFADPGWKSISRLAERGLLCIGMLMAAGVGLPFTWLMLALLPGAKGRMPRVVSDSEPVGFNALINCAAFGLLCAEAATSMPGAINTIPETMLVIIVLRILSAPLLMVIV
jgi:hypothetical protein